MNAEFTITHNLGADLPDLIVKFFVSTDGTDTNSSEIAYANSDASVNNRTGFVIYALSDDQIKIQTGSNGVLMLNEGTGGLETIDTESYYYRVVIRRVD